MSGPRRALITGVRGQDGSYLAELLLDKGYEVHGTVRGVGTGQPDRIAHLRDRVKLHRADLLDQDSLADALRAARPSEIYHFAAVSFAGGSWDNPVASTEITGVGVVRLLEAVRELAPEARFCQASSSEIFAAAGLSPQSEQTPLHARTPYGIAKAFGHMATVSYREAQGLHASSAILFNHESPRRGLEFVTRKISWSAAAIKHGLESKLALGNLDSKRDWGYAKDYVEAMWLMLQQEHPGDYVIATGEAHSVRECCQIAFEEAGLGDYEDYVAIDPRFVRPAEAERPVGDASKARRALAWHPTTTFEELIRLMTRSDLELLGEKLERGVGRGTS